MIRVLMTADAVGGVWSYAMQLCAALARADVQVVLAVMGPAPSPSQRRQAQALGNVTLAEAEYRLEWMPDAWGDVDRAGEWLLELACSNRCDLVHLNDYSHAALPWGRPVLLVAHSCVPSWWRAVHGRPAPSQWDEYRRRLKAGVEAADCVVAPTLAYLRELRHLYGPLEHARVVYHGYAAPPMPAPREQRAEIILSAGRIWDEAKNMRVLDAAARGLEWPVLIAGATQPPGSEAGHDRSSVRFRHARLLGPLSTEALAGWLWRARVYVSTALYEPFGLSVLEAAAAGCALVLSDLPSLRELWGDSALFVAGRDARALHATLQRLTTDPIRLQALALAARKRAAGFAPNRMRAEYLQLYLRLLQLPSRPSALQSNL